MRRRTSAAVAAWGGGGTHPVPVRERDLVRVQVARGAAELAAVRDGLELLHLRLEAVDKHHELLAHAGRGRGLAVGAGEEGDLGPLAGEQVQGVNDLRELGHVDAPPEAQDHEGIARVVDVCERIENREGVDCARSKAEAKTLQGEAYLAR